MRKLAIAAAAALAALVLPSTPASADHRGGTRVFVHVGSGAQWGHPGWRGHWRPAPRWRSHWRLAPRRGHWRRPARAWARPCRSMWWDGWAWRCGR